MNFEIGKQYIVSVSENGIIPIEEFSDERYFDIEYDSIDFLTDEEKVVIINNVLNNIRAEIEKKIVKRPRLDFKDSERDRNDAFLEVLDIIDKYKAVVLEGEEE